MKINSAYIEAFGGIKDRSYTFDEGLSEILADNGEGKSTLAAFIKAMLYGLEGTASRKKTAGNEYERYLPWDGGHFGGTLTVTCRFGSFRIARYFSAAGKQYGELSVIDLATEKPSDALGEVPGRTLLGVDGESFLMTAYLSSLGITAGKTDDISAKLVGVEGERWDMTDYDDAVKYLEEQRKAIKLFKGRGKTASLTIAEERRDTTERRLREAEAAARAADEIAAGISAGRAQQKAIAASITQLDEVIKKRDAKRFAERTRAERVEQLKKNIEAAERDIAAAREEFPGDLPNDIVIDRLSADVQQHQNLARSVAAYTPMPALPDEAAIAECEAALEEHKRAHIALANTNQPTIVGEAAGGHILPIIAMLAALLAIAGAVLLFVAPIVGAILLTVALLPGVLSLLCLRRSRAENAVAEEYRRVNDIYTATLAKVRQVFSAHGIDPAEDLTELREKRVAAMAKAENEARDRAALTELSDRLRTQFAAYGVAELDAADAITTLRARRQALRNAEERKRIRTQEYEQYTATAEKSEAVDDPRSDEELHEELADKRRQQDELTAELARKEQEEENYRRLADEREALEDELAEYNTECHTLAHRVEVLDQAKSYLATARERLEVRCFGGLRERLSHYNALLLSSHGITMRIDTDLCLQLGENGESGTTHEAFYYSTGVRAVADVCLRLAMTDTLFKEEAPPLILDDPFMALDDENLAAARELLQTLAKERQILYLTCHPSRSLVAQ